MLQISFIRDHKDEVVKRLSLRLSNAEILISEVLKLDEKRRATQTQLDESSASLNSLSKEVGQLFKNGEVKKANAIKQSSSDLKTLKAKYQEQLTSIKEQLQSLLYTIPNLPHCSVPKGQTDNDNEVVFEAGTVPELADQALPHWELAKKYDEAFADLDWLRTPFKHSDYDHGYQSYPFLFMPKKINPRAIKKINEKRNEWMDDLQKSGISTRPATHAVHMLSFYKEKYDLMPEDFPNAYAADQCSISLPLFHGMEPEEQRRVIEVIKSYKF